MGIEKRLHLIMASNRLTASSFADRIGVQRSNVSHVLNGRNKPGYDFLLKVIHAFPKVNTHWLLTGEEVSASVEVPVESIIEANVQAVIPVKSSEDRKEDSNPSKNIIKTIVFYDDFSFDAFIPSEK